MPSGMARMVLGARGGAARWPWLQGVAVQGNRAGLLASNAPPTILLGWVGSGSGDISGQRFANRRRSLRFFAPKSCLG